MKASELKSHHVFTSPENDPREWSPVERAWRYLWLKTRQEAGVRCRCPDPYHGFSSWVKDPGQSLTAEARQASTLYDFPVWPLPDEKRPREEAPEAFSEPEPATLRQMVVSKKFVHLEQNGGTSRIKVLPGAKLLGGGAEVVADVLTPVLYYLEPSVAASYGEPVFLEIEAYQTDQVIPPDVPRTYLATIHWVNGRVYHLFQLEA